MISPGYTICLVSIAKREGVGIRGVDLPEECQLMKIHFNSFVY